MSISLFSELKRRNVFKVAAGYGILGWLVLQIADVVVPILELPEWTLKFLLFVGFLGFPFAIFLAWAYELTPDGIKLESEVDRGQSITTQTGRRLNYAVIALLVIALSYFIFKSITPESSTPLNQTTEVIGDSSLLSKDVSEPEFEPAGSSIAVLPFVNMSSDPEQEYFSDGITEEILNVLAKATKLHVTSRTSAFYYKGRDFKLSDVAKELGVANILEGSVRKSGNRIRITAQLIEAESDRHLWSETYDRELTDIFAIQDEIAESIGIVLKSMLEDERYVNREPTNNLDAYDLFLKGRVAFHRREVQEALTYLNKAVDLDPNFADAWTYLGAALVVAPGYQTEITAEQAIRQAGTVIDRALELAPKSSLANASKANYILHQFRWLDSELYLNKAVEYDPSDSTALLWLGIQHLSMGHIESAKSILNKSITVDPVSGINNAYLSLSYLSNGEYERGYHHSIKAIELGWEIAYRFLLPGMLKGYIEENPIDIIERYVESDRRRDIYFVMLESPFEFEKQNLSNGSEQNVNQLEIPLQYLTHGYDDVFLDKILEHWNENQLTYDRVLTFLRLIWMPQYRDLVQDPRFFRLATYLNMDKYWQEQGYPDGCKLNTTGEPRLDCE